jgi:hypothetical protein
MRSAPSCPVCRGPGRPSGHRHRQPLFACTACSIEFAGHAVEEPGLFDLPRNEGRPAVHKAASLPVDSRRSAITPIDLTIPDNNHPKQVGDHAEQYCA